MTEQVEWLSEETARRMIEGVERYPCWIERKLVWVEDAACLMQLRDFREHLTRSEHLGYTDSPAAAPAAVVDPPNTAQSGKGA